MIYSIADVLSYGLELPHASAQGQVPSRARWARRSLRLNLDGRTMRFASVDDFSFAVECRTSVPSHRFYTIFEMSLKELQEQTACIKAVEKRLAAILESALCDGSSCGDGLARMELKTFSLDHGWRDLFCSLIDLSDRFDAYKRLAVIKYLQYLGARQDALRLSYMSKQNNRRRANGPEIEPLATLFNETLLFDTSLSHDSSNLDSLQRLPQGEAVKLYALPGHAIAIRLAKYDFQLLNEDGWQLRDPSGFLYQLRSGNFLIGRGSDSDIQLDRSFSHISRRHLRIEPIDDHIISLTDFSSHGTFAPPLQTERVLRAAPSELLR